MRRSVAAIIVLLSLAFVASLAYGAPKDKNAPQTRDLVGHVMNKGDAPLPNAIVYLKNTRTLTVKTFITGPDGKYRFPALAPNVDYEVYAEHQGKRSDTKTLSSFDSRAQANINLTIDVAK